MKPGKKTWVWGTASIVLVVLLIWAFWPEYGSGYSEEQRRNWNEMIAATEGKGKEYADALSPWGKSLYKEKMENRREQTDAHVWDMKNQEPCPEMLPLEGMSIPSLKGLADKGNGRACLELVFRSFDEGTDDVRYGDDFAFPDFSSIYESEMYLKKAVGLGERGSDFLLRLFEYRKGNGDDAGIRLLKGYEAFLSLLDQGDFVLGKIYLYLDPNGETPLFRLEEGLNRKAGQGDGEALRNAGHLSLLRQIRGRRLDGEYTVQSIYWEIWGNVNNGNATHKIKESINFIKEIVPSQSGKLKEVEDAILEWLEAREWKSRLSAMEIPVNRLGEAAESGDLHAKYLWCQYMLVSQRSFSRKDWQRYLEYVNELIKKGGIYRGRNSIHPSVDMYRAWWCFYQAPTNARELLENISKKEIVSQYSGEANTLEMKEMELISMNSMKDFSDYPVMWSLDKEKEKLYAFQLIERAAEEGEPMAMYCFSKILNEEGEIGEDGRRAWALIQKLKSWRKEITGRLLSDNMGQDTEKEGRRNSWHARSFHDSVSIQELDIVSRHGDMPGMTLREAFEQFLLLRLSLNDDYPPFDEMLQASKVREQFEKQGFKIPKDQE